MARQYDFVSTLWSFGQDARWRRFLVSRIPKDARVLDVATGTGMVATELVKRGCRVTGLDQSEQMIRSSRASDRVAFLLGQAERLPFPDDSFDAVTFTYLLRYVDDPPATLSELTRVIRPGGTLGCLEFHVPPNPVWRAAWLAYTRVVMPPVGRLVSREWYGVGRFLGRSITEFYRSYPLPVQLGWWRDAGLDPVGFRTMTLGGGVVIWGHTRGG